jgi:hypothetical protein
MRLKFLKQRFAGDRTFQAGEVAEVDDEVAAQIVKEGAASSTDDDVTVFTPDAQIEPPKDPPAKPKK